MSNSLNFRRIQVSTLITDDHRFQQLSRPLTNASVDSVVNFRVLARLDDSKEKFACRKLQFVDIFVESLAFERLHVVHDDSSDNVKPV